MQIILGNVNYLVRFRKVSWFALIDDPADWLIVYFENTKNCDVIVCG